MKEDTFQSSLEARAFLSRLDFYIKELEKEVYRLEKENKDLHFRILELELEKKIPKFIEIAN